MSMFGKLHNETPGSHTKDQFHKCLESQGFLCFYCAVPICEKSADPDCEATEDHLLAISRGGSDFMWNIVGACQRCNRLKGTLLPGQFLRRLFRFVPPVDANGQFSTGNTPLGASTVLPFQRTVLASSEIAENHLEVTPFVASAVRYIADRCTMEQDETSYFAKRRQLLRQQVLEISRLQLESAGQLVLPIFGDNSARKLLRTEAQCMAVKGMQVTA